MPRKLNLFSFRGRISSNVQINSRYDDLLHRRIISVEDTLTRCLQASLTRLREVCEVVTTRRSWKFVGQADANEPKPLENTDYFATAKITKTRTSNVISNTFQNHNLIRRNIEAVTTRRSWKPFAQKARGFESLFLRQIKGQPSPKSSVVFLFLWLRYERILTPLCDSSSRRMGFAFEL